MTMKVMTLNVNGLRAAVQKGLFEWLKTQDFDFICFQETKLQADVLDADPTLHLPGYTQHYAHALKKGYSGVALLAKHAPLNWRDKLNSSVIDEEGRYIEYEYPHLTVASIYFPSGSSGEDRQKVKMQFLKTIEAPLQQLLQSGKPCILCGDYNIAHAPIDLKNWKANQKNSGFLPEERAWMDRLFLDLGFVDAFRYHHPQAEVYTWWSFRGKAYEKNVGWRIDYQVISPSLKDKIREAYVLREPKFSDHASLIVEYDVE